MVVVGLADENRVFWKILVVDLDKDELTFCRKFLNFSLRVGVVVGIAAAAEEHTHGFSRTNK